jgi:glycosyltransferase involved in cell wall biosynthesis
MNINHPQQKQHFVHVSTWSKNNVMKMITNTNVPNIISSHVTIPNSVFTDIVVPTHDLLLNKARGFSFMACFERGGDVAKRVHNVLTQRQKDLDWGKFIDCAYYCNEKQSDKKSMFNILQNTRYFLYPLVCPNVRNYSIHRDTFGCVVAEAVAMGVEVLSYPIAALPEHYNDMITWLPVPQSLNIYDVNNNVHDTCSYDMFSDDQVNVIASFIEEFDKTYEDRQFVRYRNACKVRERFGIESVGKQWVDFVQSSLQ